MRIHHAALRVRDLEASRAFYERWFGATSGDIYRNPAKGYASYFLRFPGGAADLELQVFAAVEFIQPDPLSHHLALSLGSPSEVDVLAARLLEAGVPILDGPRRTGDGYYEAAFLDPDGHRLEVTAI
jgi:lactoylglutathione lyase